MSNAPATTGTHGFSGNCTPDKIGSFYQETFSVGIFEWLSKSGGKGVKKSAVKVRVSGSVSKEMVVYETAREIVTELDTGTYKGPKIVKIR